MISSRSLNLLVASIASIGSDHYARYKGEKTPSLFDDAGNKSWDEDAHPRVEKGSKEAHGGQFTSKQGDSDNTKPKPQQLQPMFGSGYKPEAKAKQGSLFETMGGGGDQMPLFPDDATPDDLLSPKKLFDDKLESMKSRRDPEGISKNPVDVAEKSKQSAGENLLASKAKSSTEAVDPMKTIEEHINDHGGPESLTADSTEAIRRKLYRPGVGAPSHEEIRNAAMAMRGAPHEDPREELKQINTKFAELSDKQVPMIRQQMDLENELRELRVTKFDPLMEEEQWKARNAKMRGVKKRLDNLNEKLRPITKELDGIRDRSYEVMNAIREQDKAKEKQSPEAKADLSPGSPSEGEMKTIPLRERKSYAEQMARDGMKQTDLADHLMKRGVASVDARKLASDATFTTGVEKEEASKPTPGENLLASNSKKQEEPSKTDEGRKHWYGMNNRPLSIGTQPKGFTDHQPNHEAFRHGAVAYDRPLSEEEQKSFELTPIRDKSDISDVAKKVVSELGEYAGEYANDDELLEDRLKQSDIRKIVGHVPDRNELIAEIKKHAKGDSPGIVMPSKTVSNDQAKPGDQLGLFGEATKAPSKPPRLKVDEPKAKQGGLFDTHGNPDQMDLFGDGVMGSNMVYKPEAKKEEAKPTPGENLLASQSLSKEQISNPRKTDSDNPHNLDGQAGEDYRFTSRFVPKYVNEMGDMESRARAIRGLMKDSHPDAQAALAKDLVVLSPETYAHIRNDKNIKGKDYEHAFSKSATEHKQADKPESTLSPGDNFLASQKKSEVATPKTMDHEAIARKAVDEGTSVWAASKAMGHGGITDLSSEDRTKIAAAHEKLRDEQTKAEEAKRSFVSPARAASQAKFRAKQEAEAKSEVAKPHGEKAFEAAEAAESKDATPREVAKAAQEHLDKDYEYARASEIGNAGEDLKGSARHRVNAWKGLADAEKDGTAEKLVNREGLHRLEPHDLMTHADKNPLTSLAMHYALRNFPPAPAGQTETHAAEKNREQYLDAYRAIKDKANELAASTPDHAVGAAVSMMRDFVSNKLREFRGQEEGESALTAKDKFNPTANLLIKTHNALSASTYKNKNGVMGRLEEFSKEANDKYDNALKPGKLSSLEDKKSFIDKLSNHAKDIIEGHSLNKTFGKESEKRDVNRFDPSEAYVKIATRKGGRDLSKITADPIKAVDHMVNDMGMRGVQWGNSVTDDERKHHAGKALEAIADLADVTGLHPKDIALDGNLGLAIGARGKGTASAHYEPGNKVINLTRANGVGTLAHEWGHAFDHMLNGFGLETTNKGDKVVKKGGYMSNDTDTHEIRPKKQINENNPWVGKTSTPERHEASGMIVTKRPLSEIREAYRGLNQVSKGFRDRLKKALQEDVNKGKLNPKKANDYWNSDHEIFARSFEQYVMHKMKENGIENTYLAGMSKGHKYWPTPEESKAMAPAFDKIFEQYRKEKHGSGEPIKYSRREAFPELFNDDSQYSPVVLARYGFNVAEFADHYAGKDQMKWDFGDDAEPVSGGKPSRIRSQQKVQKAANNGKLKIVGTTSDHNECERCGRKDLAKTIVVETLDAQGNGTGELHYYGSDCISKIMGKSEKHIETKVMEADYQKFLKSKKDAYSWQSSEDLEYDENACKLAADLYCAMAALYSVDRYEFREQLHPRDSIGRFSKVRSLVERPDIANHHSLFALNQDTPTRLYVTDSMKGFRNLIGDASRRSQAKGGDGSEESLWQEIDKDRLRTMLAEVNAKDKEMRKNGGKGLDELFNYNGVIPKMIAERLSGGSRFFDPQKLKAKWHEQAPPPPAPKPDPAQTPSQAPNISIDMPKGKQGKQATHAEPKAPDKPHDGLSTRKRNQVNALIADLVSDNPEIVEEFRPILINAWKQKIQEVNDHNQAIRQITGTRTPQGMSALIRGARAKTLNPAEKKNFDIMVDSAENSEFAHYLQGNGEDGLLDFLSEGVKGQPDILDEDVAELAISMAGPDFLRGFDPGEAPSDKESEWEETPFSSHAAREYYRANFMDDWEVDLYAGPNQMMFDWDEAAHPREPKGSEGSIGGEFTKKASSEVDRGYRNVVSGAQSSPSDIASYKNTDRPIGVSVQPRPLSPRVVGLLAQHAEHGKNVFLDSGIASTVSKGEGVDFTKVFNKYREILEQVSPSHRHRVMVVAPDHLEKTAEGEFRGDQDKTLDLQSKWANEIKEIQDMGASVIVPVQRGEQGLSAAAALATDAIDFSNGKTIFGIPYNKGAWDDKSILEFARKSKGTEAKIHLLGGGKQKVDALTQQIHEIDPDMIVTGDAASELRNRSRKQKKEAESSSMEVKKPAELKDVYVLQPRAKAGGEHSDVDGKFYKGGSLMPVHGMFSGMEKPPAKEKKSDGTSPVAKEDQDKQPRQIRQRSAQDIEAERERMEEQRKWDELNAGPIKDLFHGWIGDRPNSKAFKAAPGHKFWAPMAERLGKDGVEKLTEFMRSKAIEREKRDRKEPMYSNVKKGMIDPEEQIAGYVENIEYGIKEYQHFHTKKHLKAVPNSRAGEVWLDAFIADSSIDDKLELNNKLKELLGSEKEKYSSQGGFEKYSMPSKAQAEAGNYRMKHVRIAGLDVSIETPKGKRRRPEWPPMAADYGYIKGTTGKDGDHLDVFVGPKPDSEVVYVIDQSNKEGGFDEHKIMLGFVGIKNAVECYKRCYTPGWKVGPVTAMTIGQFKNWIRDGKHKKPIEMQVSKYSSKSEDAILPSSSC